MKSKNEMAIVDALYSINYSQAHTSISRAKIEACSTRTKLHDIGFYHSPKNT